MVNRRDFLRGLAALAGSGVWMQTASARALAENKAVHLAAAWQAGSAYQVGILEVGAGVRLRAALDVPTRAHGLLAEPAGTLLAVARRPGDWLVRWDRSGQALAWRWIEPRRAFTGHVIRDGSRVFTTETDLDTGAGLVGVRHADSLEKLDEWPTQGIDPHQLLWDARRPGRLVVANGGVPTQPETGRLKKHLERMDSSIVCLDAASGAVEQAWRLADPRLSLRHLAWRGRGEDAVLGIALQAEHDDPAARQGAPVLALLAQGQLRAVPGPDLKGYGGSIAAHAEGFAVSCPRAQGLALYGPRGEWQRLLALPEACPLDVAGQALVAGGRDGILGQGGFHPLQPAGLASLRLDNHWLALPDVA